MCISLLETEETEDGAFRDAENFRAISAANFTRTIARVTYSNTHIMNVLCLQWDISNFL